jgi:transcriptional regulator with XRE-family HTH domain
VENLKKQDEDMCRLIDTGPLSPSAYFADRMRTARHRASLSLKETALRSGISFQALSKWERGEVLRPNPKHLLSVAEALGISPPERIFDWLEESRILSSETIERAEAFIGEAKSNDRQPSSGFSTTETARNSVRFAGSGGVSPKGLSGSTLVRVIRDILDGNSDDAPFRYFGYRLMDARLRAGFALSDVESACRISKQSLSRWERGEVLRPDYTSLQRVAVFLNIVPASKAFAWIDENNQLLRERDILRSIDGVRAARSESERTPDPDADFMAPQGNNDETQQESTASKGSHAKTTRN